MTTIILSRIPGLIGLGGQEILLMLLIPIGCLIGSLVALVSVLRSDFRGPSDKLIWVLVVLFMPFLGAILYFFIGRQQRVV